MTSPGTPGYGNDAVKSNDGTTTDERELTDGEISISEIMYDSGPNQNQAQWIELYNSSMMQALNLKGWKLRIRNFHDRNAAYIEGTVTFKDVVILPNQTLLIVPGKAATDLPENRVYDLYRNHRRDLRHDPFSTSPESDWLPSDTHGYGSSRVAQRRCSGRRSRESDS